MHKFGIDVTAAQYVLFSFLAASAIGTLLGGPIGDKIGRRMVILWSILGAAPFALLLPWTPLWAVVVLSIVVGFVMSSAFSAILVYAIELSPANTGTISGLFFGFSFGLGGVASAVFGVLADQIGIESVFVFASVLPLLGAVAFLLPKNR
jgi:FSR family fosmidomycin resistance protein-like MFS transporter